MTLHVTCRLFIYDASVPLLTVL
jgi:hypothetical protein